MRRIRALWMALSLALLSVLAGCAQPTSGNKASGNCSPWSDPGCPCPPGTEIGGYACVEPANTRIDVTMDTTAGGTSNAVTFGYVHGSWCLAASDWLQAAEVENGTLRLVESAKGSAFQLQATASHAEVHLRVATANRTACQTFRYDPWSFEPDPPANETWIEVVAPARVELQVHTDGGGCWSTRRFTGDLQAGWTYLGDSDGHTVCA